MRTLLYEWNRYSVTKQAAHPAPIIMGAMCLDNHHANIQV